MKFNFIEAADSIGGGITIEGYYFVESSVQGWNDHGGFSDLTDIAVVRGILVEDENIIKIEIKFLFKDYEGDEKVCNIVNELREEIIENIRSSDYL